MVGLWKRLRDRWHRDSAERDVAQEEEDRLREERLHDTFLAGGLTDYERDSEPPADPAP
jgi:hypothetical protein